MRNEKCQQDNDPRDSVVILTWIFDPCAALYSSKNAIYANELKQPLHVSKLQIRGPGIICDCIYMKALTFEIKPKYEPVI